MSDKVREYEGNGFTLTFDRHRCLHAEECVRGAPQVFDPTRRRWIDPAGADLATVAGVVVRCPTGALHYTRHDGQPGETVEPDNVMLVDRDGPLYLRGDIRVVREDGAEILRDTRVALCRCGLSQRKPFCDGSHTEGGFRDTGELAEIAAEESGTEGPVVVRVLASASLRVEGPVTIRGSGGGDVRRARVSLCRCGASQRKPFCDGSHGPAGFTDD